MTTGSADRSGAEAGRVFDELLVMQVWSGDRRAAERLAARWHPRLMRTARRLLGEEEMARGAVQDAWVSILKGIGSLRDPARFAPWAFGILRRRCADVIRKASRRRQWEAQGDPPEQAESPRAEDGLAIRQAFATLPADQRLAAHLFYVEGLTLGEIAIAADIPLGTAKSRLFHARLKLKEALKGDEG
jgi:RNA polymerase sigma-70 factor (ECF subfamily)